MRGGWGGECCRRAEKERDENKNLSRQEQASERSVCPSYLRISSECAFIVIIFILYYLNITINILQHDLFVQTRTGTFLASALLLLHLHVWFSR